MAHPIPTKPRRCRVIFAEESRTREPVEVLAYREGHPKGPLLSVLKLNPKELERDPSHYDLLISPPADGDNHYLGIKSSQRYGAFIKLFGEVAEGTFTRSPDSSPVKFRLLSPFDPQVYAGSTFVFEDGESFKVGYDGTCHGRPSIEGARIDRIGGVNTDIAHQMANIFGFDRKIINSTLETDGTGVKVGSGLILSLTEEDSKKHDRQGYVCRIPIVRID